MTPHDWYVENRTAFVVRTLELREERLFAEQTSAVRTLHRYEVLFAILIVLMVSAAIVYGRTKRSITSP